MSARSSVVCFVQYYLYLRGGEGDEDAIVDKQLTSCKRGFAISKLCAFFEPD
ncbi:MAG: hypothetical protein V3V96_11915 [Acidiferrobacterales bacterium]